MVATWFERAYPRFRANVDYNLAMLEQVVACAQERGLHVVLVELPLNRGAVRGRFDEVLATYQRPVRAMARERHVPYLDLERENAIPSSDFHDLMHLVEPGRARWQQRLARELVALMARDDARAERSTLTLRPGATHTRVRHAGPSLRAVGRRLAGAVLGKANTCSSPCSSSGRVSQ